MYKMKKKQKIAWNALLWVCCIAGSILNILLFLKDCSVFMRRIGFYDSIILYFLMVFGCVFVIPCVLLYSMLNHWNKENQTALVVAQYLITAFLFAFGMFYPLALKSDFSQYAQGLSLNDFEQKVESGEDGFYFVISTGETGYMTKLEQEEKKTALINWLDFPSEYQIDKAMYYYYNDSVSANVSEETVAMLQDWGVEELPACIYIQSDRSPIVFNDLPIGTILSWRTKGIPKGADFQQFLDENFEKC